MYRCEVCTASSKPNESMLKHTIYRGITIGDGPTKKVIANYQVAREVAVCRTCHCALDSGTPLSTLKRNYAATRERLHSRIVSSYQLRPSSLYQE